MPIGNGPDVPSYNKDEEERIKHQDEVEKWWNSLDESYQIELMEDFYPDKPIILDADEMWSGLEWQDKLDIYQEAEGFEVRV